METKPFSLQSPEQIAKDYGGNKQKIAEAMQMGIIDPTAGTLAGMFIDRMRSAAQVEGVPQQTVAQQIFTPPQPPMAAPAAPMPPAAPAGLGATPEAAMLPPEAAPPMGMAMGGMVPPHAIGGGLPDLPLPEDMFDEPSNGSYAGGGLVAFADGGGVDLDAFRRAIIQQESGGRYGIPNAQGSGAMGIGQIMPATARALAKRLGLEYRPDLLAGTGKAARQYQDALTSEATREAWEYGGGDIGRAAAYYFAGPNQKGWGEKTRKYQSDIMRRLGMDGGESTSLPERDIEAPEGRRASFEDQYAVAKKRFEELPDAGLDELGTYYREELAPEKREKARKDDMWMALAQIGASMASSKSPYFLQATGEAIAAALPGVAASKKERKDAEREARTGLREVLGLKRAEQKEVLEYAKDLHAIEMGAETSEIERRTRAAEAAAARQHDISMEGIRSANRLAEIKEQGKVTNTQFEQLVAARRAQIIDRLKQGLPVTDPKGVTAVPRGGRQLAESEINALANSWALFDLNQYKGSATAGLVAPGLTSAPTAGAGGGQQQVVDVAWNP